MNIVFPKEETILINQINTYYKNEEFNKIINLKDDILKSLDFLKTYKKDILDIYVISLFNLREFDKIISFCDELRKQGIETYVIYSYTLMILISQNDLFYAKSLIKKMKLITDPIILDCINEDEALYNKIFALEKDILINEGPLLILINFTNELVQEMMNKNFDNNYILMRWFDLLNLLYEYGMNLEVLEKFIKSLEIIYEIQIA